MSSAAQPFRVGDCFVIVGKLAHLWIVLSDPEKDDERVLLVNVTTLEAYKDQTCKLTCGSHPFITHDSCVNFGAAKLVSLATLINLEAQGKLRWHEPLSEKTYRYIFEMAILSPETPYLGSELLLAQRLAKPYRTVE